jgi:hypothetical protein
MFGSPNNISGRHASKEHSRCFQWIQNEPSPSLKITSTAISQRWLTKNSFDSGLNPVL